METKVDVRRLGLYLVFAFGIAWATALVIYLNGGLAHSPELIPRTGITLALVLLAIPYMWAPATAHILTRMLTHEGRRDLMLRPNFRASWRYWLAGWFLPGLLTIAGAAVFFLLFPRYFDSGLALVRKTMGTVPALSGMSPWMLIAFQTLAAMLISPVANTVATFGEEFGWRAYMLPKLMALGWRKAVVVSGLIWGVWHWPVIFMGYEYGFAYPGYPWVGPLLFIWIAFCFGTFLSWLTVRSQSVWPAAIGHAAINGIAAIGVIVTAGKPNTLLGPLPVGVVGVLGYAVLAVYLLVGARPAMNRKK